MEKALVLYSGGLDSRLAVKLMQERGFEVEALHLALPFGCGCCNLGCNFNFTQKEKVKLTIFDCGKGKLLEEYLSILKNPKHGTGSGINPCRDCKIFMFKKAKEYADKNKINVIATGEVLGQRPMSQTRDSMNIIDKQLNFTLTRPLIDIGIVGRMRNKQRELAKKYNFTYPEPGGGCLLCEKNLKNRFKVLLEKNLINEKVLPLVSIGRHFIINDSWCIVSRNEQESNIIETFQSHLYSDIKTPAVYFNGSIETAKKLQKAYKDKNIKEFEVYKI